MCSSSRRRASLALNVGLPEVTSTATRASEHSVINVINVPRFSPEGAHRAPRFVLEGRRAFVACKRLLAPYAM